MIFLFPFFIRVENYVGTNYVNILSSLGGFALSCLLLRLSFPSFLCRLDDFTGASSPKEKLRQRTGIAKVRRSPVHHTFHSPRQLSRSSHPPPSGYPSIFHSSRRTLSDRYCQLKKTGAKLLHLILSYHSCRNSLLCNGYFPYPSLIVSS